MWPQEYIALKDIENLLICGICYEFMDTSVMTLCSHNYCSLCIRKYLHYKTQCPACFAETFEKDLRKNKILDEIITKFSQIKDKLKRVLQIHIQFSKFDENNQVSTIPKLLHQNNDTNINEQENKIIYNQIINNTSENNISPSINVQNNIFSPSTSGISRIPLMFTPKSHKRNKVTNIEKTKVVICPVCKVTISEIKINRHLDDCLKRESMKEKPQINESIRKPLPKLVFNLMKDAILRKKLKEFGLSLQGDRRTMENRLQRYIILYNAECDKSNPRSISELVKQCEDEENLERKINKTFLNKLNFTRNTEQNVIENERKKYLETHKDSFENLIKNIKRVDTTKRPSVRRSLLKESIEREINEDVPDKCQKRENLDDSMTYIEQNDFNSLKSDVYIEDSDSDSTCPLQMYSSTEPNKFFNIESSPSNNTVLQNKSETSDQENVDQEQSMLSNHSPINKTEKNDNLNAFNDISTYDPLTQSINTFCEDVSNNFKDLSNTSKYKKLRRNKELSSKNEIQQINSVSSNIKDLDSDRTLDQEERQDKKSKSVLQDIACDLSNDDNDSTDNKFNYGELHSTNYGFLNNSVINFSNLEKENVSSSPEYNRIQSLQKRTRDLMQTDNKIIPNTKKKIKKSSHNSPETKETNIEESLCTFNDETIKYLRNKSRLRKRERNITEDISVLRKSTRRKIKDNNS